MFIFISVAINPEAMYLREGSVTFVDDVTSLEDTATSAWSCATAWGVSRVDIVTSSVRHQGRSAGRGQSRVRTDMRSPRALPRRTSSQGDEAMR